MSESFLHSAITEALPDLPEVSTDILEETLQSLGIETHDDFQFVKEEDLLTALRPIQARKLFATWSLKCKSSIVVHDVISYQHGYKFQLRYENIHIMPDPRKWFFKPYCLTRTLPIRGVSVANFNVVVQQLSEPTWQFSRLIHNTMDRVPRGFDAGFGERETSKSKFEERDVAKYPKSLQDVIEGDAIGTGYDSLVKQIQNRIENVKRPTTPKIKKRRTYHDSDTDEIPPEKRASIQDTYGCSRWHVKFLPLGETAESQQQKKDELQKLFMGKRREQTPCPLKMLMKSTFYSQRQEVNQGNDVKYLLENWPYWFHEIGMTVHFNELSGVNLKETFLKNVEQKGERLLHLMKTVAMNKSKKFFQAATKLQMMGEHSGDTCHRDGASSIGLLRQKR
ncbi:hypothetical protein N1851_015824 [Merluccius polli]|uniref:Uncharacterized protein n=1 Tax=Merluccius polli TaxID=89951 RepID=A0AA47P008_MERPO|nr:hypothetical protein N1851_015824 [Merluccius polli]